MISSRNVELPPWYGQWLGIIGGSLEPFAQKVTKLRSEQGNPDADDAADESNIYPYMSPSQATQKVLGFFCQQNVK